MAILIRESKTDHEKAGVTRMLRATGMLLWPVLEMRDFLPTSGMSPDSEAILSFLLSAINWYSLLDGRQGKTGFRSPSLTPIPSAPVVQLPCSPQAFIG